MSGQFGVRRTDCRTGWQVIRPDGTVYLTVRRAEAARAIAAEVNAARKAYR